MTPAAIAPHRLLARRFGIGRNPLRRTSDRIEVAVLWIAVVIGLLAMPASAALGTAVTESGRRSAAELNSTGAPVLVRTLEGVPPSPAATVVVRSAVLATWTDASGAMHQGVVSVPAGTRAGTELTVWLDGAGRLVDPPQRQGVSIAAGVLAGLGAFVGGLTLLALLVALVRAGLDRLRLRAWQAELSRLRPPTG